MNFQCIECQKMKREDEFYSFHGMRNAICITCYEKKKKRQGRSRVCRECRQQKPREEFEMRGKVRRICNACWNASYRARQDPKKQSRIQKERIEKEKNYKKPGIYAFDELSMHQICYDAKRYWIEGIEHVR